MGLGMPTPLPPPGAGTTTIMTTMSAMAGNMTSSSMRSGMSSAPQCRQPPAYKVAQQMARLHRLGRANSHEGVTYRGTDHEDGTTSSQIALPFTHGSHSPSYTHLFDLCSLRLLTFSLSTFTHNEECRFVGENTLSLLSE